MMYVLTIFIVMGIILSLIRLIKGKEAESRVVAVDVLTTLTSAVLLLYALVSGNVLVLDVVLVYSILSFAAVIALARYLEGGL
ncbi:MAG: cation:proton antiporter [Clostridiales bacterium]|nr:cation:proton antiporter [Clostridiales bacterium]